MSSEAIMLQRIKIGKSVNNILSRRTQNSVLTPDTTISHTIAERERVRENERESCNAKMKIIIFSIISF